MLLLVDEVKKRTQFLHGYLEQLETSLNRRKYQEALNFISHQKSNINHTNVSRYNPNTFLIDSLKTKNLKIQQTLQSLKKEKAHLESQVDIAKKKSGGIQNPMTLQKVLSVVSKISFTLKDIRKLQLEPMTLQTDYQTLTISTLQQKTYKIPLNKIFFTQRKSNLLNINCHVETQKPSNSQQFLYIAFKFHDEATSNIWHNALTFGKIFSEAKGNRYLFLTKNNTEYMEPLLISKSFNNRILTEESQVFPYGNNQKTSSVFKNNYVPQNSQKIKAPLYTSAINQKPKSIPDNPFNQPQKNLTNSMINDPTKKLLNYSTFRPSPLNRVRGKSMYLDFYIGKNGQQFKGQRDQDYINDQSNFFQSKSQHKSSKGNFRKASQDITLRPKNPSHQQKKLEKFRSQRNLMDDILSQSNQKTNNKQSSVYQSNSKRIDFQIEKKNELLERNNRNLERSIANTFRPEDNIRWIKENDQAMSRSSRHTKNTNPRFKEELEYTLEDPSKNNEKDSEKIDEASETYEVSPTFPKKIVYEDGSNIRLYPVETSQTRPKVNSKTTSQFDSQQNEGVEPLQEAQENQHSESRIVRNQRLNTLDSETEKSHEIHESNSEDHEEQQFEQLLQDLKKGLVLTKCAEGSFWTREKEIKLSENENTLLVIDVKDKKIKKIGVSEIVTVEYGKFGKGIIKHIQQIQEKKCMLLSVQEGKEIKKLQFVGNNPEKLFIFATNLNYYVETFKST